MKRFLYIFGVLFISILLVCSMIVAALMSDKVETAAVRLATDELARALGTKAHVGAMEYRFPARLAIRDIYIEDLQHDTLLYVDEIYAHFRPLGLRKGEIYFSHVHLSNAVGKLYMTEKRLEDGETKKEWNYQFLVDAFRTDKQKEKNNPFQSLIAVHDIRFDNLRLNYKDYLLQLQYAEMDLHHFTADSLDAQIVDLAMNMRKRNVPSTALFVESVKARMILNDTILCFPTLEARLPNSRLDLSGVAVRFPDQDTISLRQSAHEIHFALGFNEAVLVPADLALFAERVKGLRQPVTLRGRLGGTLDSLYFENIAVRYNGQLLLEGNVSAIGLPDLNNPYLHANLQDLHTNGARLQDFLSHLYGRPFHLPAEVHRLGEIHYRGLAEGHLHDLTLHGAFRTALGTITTDGFFRSDSLFEHMNYDARVVGRKFRVGKLLAHAPLGTVTLDFQSKGNIVKGVVQGDVRAHVRDLTYNGYTYEDIHINGQYEPKRYNGQLAIQDSHLDLAFDGVVDLRDRNPEINFNLLCRHFDSAPLGIKSIGDHLKTHFSLAVDMNGVEPDRMSGYLVIDSLFVATQRDSILMQQLSLLVSSGEDMSKAITLRSDYLTAQIDGIFRFSDIEPSMQAMLHHYLPNAIPMPVDAWLPVSFTMNIDGQRLRGIQRLFFAPITLSDHPTFHAEVDLSSGREPDINLRFFAPGVRAGSTPVHDLTVTLNTVDTLRHTGAKGSGLSLSLSAEAMQMHTVLSTLAFRDTLLTHLTLRQQAQLDEQLPKGWRNLTPRELQRALSDDLTFKEKQHVLLTAQRAGTYGGDVQMITHFSRYAKKPLVDFHIMPSTLLLRDSLYTIGESRITYTAAEKSVQVNHFLFEGGGQHLRAHGIASASHNDTLDVDLQRIDASYVVPFILPVQTIMFNGLLTGQAKVAGAFRQPSIESQIHIDSMGLNNCYFGDAEVDLHIYPERRQQNTVLPPQLQFHADVDRPNRHVVGLDGEAIFDGSGRWKLDMMADSVPLAFINHWTTNVLKDLDGNATGHVVVGGRKGLTYVLLRAEAQNASLTLPWTGARYTIDHDTIVMDTTAILFPEVHLHDAEGNPVVVTGGVYHDQFRDWGLDIHVDVSNALAFDSNAKGEMLRGKVYASGHVDVTGDENDLHVRADARTSGKSQFRLSIDNASSAYESNFIHFVDHPERVSKENIVETDLDNIDVQEKAKVDSTRFERRGRCILTLNIEVNPLLLFQLVIGEQNGDMIQARGNGALRMTYDTQTGDVHLLGTYEIDRGTLSYTVANMIRKEFTIGEGSSIMFSGDASNPQLDVTAKYRVTANLKDLFGDELEHIATSRTNIPVLTCLHLRGALSNPSLNFSLELPLSDQSIQQQVRQVINTDEMLMRQVIYLLVFGRFFTPDYMSQSQYATLNSTYSLLSSTVTGQINAWLSKLTNMVTLGVAIRTEGEGAGASQEYEAQFQIQPVDRLIINGNVGYRYNDISNQPFFGDLDVEVLLTEDGQWRLKGYTHTVDKYSLRQASTIQGFGFIWKKDFNWLTKEQLRAKREERKAKKNAKKQNK